MNLYYVKFVVDMYSHYITAVNFAEAEQKATEKAKGKIIESIEVKQWKLE